MSTEQNKAAARRLVEEVFNGGNLSVVDELVVPNFVEHEQLPPGIPEGREGLKQVTKMMRAAYPDFKATIDDVLADGDKVVLRMTWSGTHKGDFMGMPPTGKTVSFPVFDIIRMADGKCVEHWGLMDQAGMMQQLGVMGAPAGAA